MARVENESALASLEFVKNITDHKAHDDVQRQATGRITPPQASGELHLEDIQYHLYVLEKVRQGLDDARRRGTVSQEEAENQLSKWLTE